MKIHIFQLFHLRKKINLFLLITAAAAMAEFTVLRKVPQIADAGPGWSIIRPPIGHKPT